MLQTTIMTVRPLADFTFVSIINRNHIRRCLNLFILYIVGSIKGWYFNVITSVNTLSFITSVS